MPVMPDKAVRLPARHTQTNNTPSSPHGAPARYNRTRPGRQITTENVVIHNTQPKRTCQLVGEQIQGLHALHARQGRQRACATHTNKQYAIIATRRASQEHPNSTQSTNHNTNCKERHNTQPKRTCQLVVAQIQGLHARRARQGRQSACATHTNKQYAISATRRASQVQPNSTQSINHNKKCKERHNIQPTETHLSTGCCTKPRSACPSCPTRPSECLRDTHKQTMRH